jgi:hypothetical protein
MQKQDHRQLRLQDQEQLQKLNAGVSPLRFAPVEMTHFGGSANAAFGATTNAAAMANAAATAKGSVLWFGCDERGVLDEEANLLGGYE